MGEGFVERALVNGRPEIPADAQIALAMEARTDHSWRVSLAIGNLDKGLLAILSSFSIGMWVPVRAIIERVDEHEVEVLAAVSRMFSIGLVDVEGTTTRRPSGDSWVSRSA